jgi:hypothetical protein
MLPGRYITNESISWHSTRCVKCHDKLKTLELLGRHLGMYTDRTEIHGAPDAINITFSA